jgi:hypothetical protein
MKRARQRTGCRCVSDKESIAIYNDDHGPCDVWGIDHTGKEFEATARIRTAKIRCLRCRNISLQLIPILPTP